jgi:hypothetical protein
VNLESRYSAFDGMSSSALKGLPFWFVGKGIFKSGEYSKFDLREDSFKYLKKTMEGGDNFYQSKAIETFSQVYFKNKEIEVLRLMIPNFNHDKPEIREASILAAFIHIQAYNKKDIDGELLNRLKMSIEDPTIPFESKFNIIRIYAFLGIKENHLPFFEKFILERIPDQEPENQLALIYSYNDVKLPQKTLRYLVGIIVKILENGYNEIALRHLNHLSRSVSIDRVLISGFLSGNENLRYSLKEFVKEYRATDSELLGEIKLKVKEKASIDEYDAELIKWITEKGIGGAE